MTRTITFILPDLFNPHCLSFLDESGLTVMQQLKQLLSKSQKQPINELQTWLCNKYNLPDNYDNSAYLMALAEGVASTRDNEGTLWLRADPVMLSATHNGIVCRGNRVLDINSEERDSLESLINDYFKGSSIVLEFSNSRQGFIKYQQNAGCEFTPLREVVGQDISHRLPTGENAAFWNGLLTELQMLLHNCDVNQKRMAKGQPTISGLWLWGQTHCPDLPKPNTVAQTLYTDDSSLSGALDKPTNIKQLASNFEISSLNSADITIYVSEIQEVYMQNDLEGWQDLYQQWVENWLIPAIESINNNNLSEIILITNDGFSYRYNSLSSWCFWRNHKFDVKGESHLF
ncbi:MAG: hypothetical protein GY829_00130 [Gammaproteobacteria bacterium]|nr:hypothetical protein [Gammaproteobacteria bacterium]